MKILSKVKYFCQMCEKQCRDANGFKCHMASESHRRQMALFLENPSKYIDEFSAQFEDQFSGLLDEMNAGEWLVANEVYSAIVRVPDHVHLNATKWTSFTEFLEYLSSKALIEMRTDAARNSGFEIRKLDPDRDEQLRQKQAEENRKREREISKTARENEKRIKMAAAAVGESAPSFSQPSGIAKDGAKVSLSLTRRPVVINGLDPNTAEEEPTQQHTLLGKSLKSSDQTLATEVKPKGSLLVDCVVKIISGEYAGLKAYVLPGSVDHGLELELLKSGMKIRAARADVETVVPNINRKVKIVDQKSAMAGSSGALLSVDVGRGVAAVYFSSIDESHEFKFDHICKLAVE